MTTTFNKNKKMEPPGGIEPPLPVYKTGVLPLNYKGTYIKDEYNNMEMPYFKVIKHMQRKMNRPLKTFYNKFQKKNGWDIYVDNPTPNGYTRRSEELNKIDNKWKKCFGKNREDQII